MSSLYHNDFRLLNGKLLAHYKFTDAMRQALDPNTAEVMDLDEVKSREAIEFVPAVVGDMTYEEQVIHEPLNVFSLIHIKG